MLGNDVFAITAQFGKAEEKAKSADRVPHGGETTWQHGTTIIRTKVVVVFRRSHTGGQLGSLARLILRAGRRREKNGNSEDPSFCQGTAILRRLRTGAGVLEGDRVVFAIADPARLDTTAGTRHIHRFIQREVGALYGNGKRARGRTGVAGQRHRNKSASASASDGAADGVSAFRDDNARAQTFHHHKVSSIDAFIWK